MKNRFLFATVMLDRTTSFGPILTKGHLPMNWREKNNTIKKKIVLKVQYLCVIMT